MTIKERDIPFIGSWLTKIELEAQAIASNCSVLSKALKTSELTESVATGPIADVQQQFVDMSIDSIHTALAEIRAVLGGDANL